MDSASLRKDRRVRVAVIGSHEFACGLQAELRAVGIRGYEVVGCIDPKDSCHRGVVADIRCLGSLVLLRKAVLDNGIDRPADERAGRSGRLGSGRHLLTRMSRARRLMVILRVETSRTLSETAQLAPGLEEVDLRELSYMEVVR